MVKCPVILNHLVVTAGRGHSRLDCRGFGRPASRRRKDLDAATSGARDGEQSGSNTTKSAQ